MCDPSETDKSLEMLREQIVGIRRRLADMQRQDAATTQSLLCIARTLDEKNLRDREDGRSADSIEHEIARIMATAAEAGLCPACGGPLECHRAPAGELCICRACGFSEFVDRQGIVRNASQPSPPPNPDDAIPPTSWVG